MFARNASSSNLQTNGRARFLFVLLVGFAVTFILGASAAWISIRSSLQSADSELRGLESRAAENWYALQIDALKKAAWRSAMRPEIVSLALGETQDSRAAKALLDIQILSQNVYAIGLFDIFNNLLVSTQSEANEESSKLADNIRILAATVLVKNTPSHQIMTNGLDQFLVFGVPVQRQGETEGVVVAASKLNAFDSHSGGVSSILLVTDHTEGLNSFQRIDKLPLEGLYLRIEFDPARVRAVSRQVLTDLLITFSFGLFVSFCGIALIGQASLVEPYRLLQSSQRELQDSERRARDLADIAELVNDTIIVTDADKNVIWINSAATRLTGFTLEEMKGRKPGDLLQGPDTDPVALAVISEALKNGNSVKAELLNYSKSRQPYWIELEITPDIAADGTVRRFIAIERDISDIRDREKLLRDAMNKAHEASTAKSNFLANMSHEIRTPMNGILGMVDVLEETGLSDDQKEATGIIRRSSEALIGIINDILDFSRIESGRIHLSIRDASIGDTIEDVLVLLKSSPYRQDVGLYLCIDKAVPRKLRFDPDRLRQALLNILGNALKFTKSGHVATTVTVETHDTRDWVRINVDDTGCGIPKEKLKTVFNAFEQVNNSQTRQFDGTGLGLAITAKLVSMMDGRIEVESDLDQGSCFSILLPISRVQDVEPMVSPVSGYKYHMCITDKKMADEVHFRCALGGMASVEERADADVVFCDDSSDCEDRASIYCTVANKPNNHGEGGVRSIVFPTYQTAFVDTIAKFLDVARADLPKQQNKISALLKGKEILLVDDNITNRIVGRKLLASEGVHVTEAENGSVAISTLAQRDFDMVLMDMSMPVMSGEEAAMAIRKTENLEGRDPIPIIALTANASRKDRDRCLKAGMNDFLCKPINKQMLIEIMVKWSAKPEGIVVNR